jgi:hypothetical protein
LIGTTLIAVGVLFLGINLVFATTGVRFWETWPLAIVVPGLMFLLVPVFFRRERWTGVFLIPAMPILTTGMILAAASVSGAWQIWGWAWPLEVLSVAAGLLLAALATRIPWLAVPAIIVGANGLILEFCAVTGAWDAWVWMWGLEIVAVGLTVLTVGWIARNLPTRIVGWSFIGAGGLASAAMMALATGYSSIAAYVFAGLLICVGVAVILADRLAPRSTPAPEAPAEPS